MLPLVTCAIAVGALLVAESRGARVGVAVFKLLASSSFVWAALSWGALGSRYGRLLLLGLLLCWLGDALLVPPGRTRWFQLGVGSFLAAHGVYAAAFLGLPGSWGVIAISALLLAGGAGGVLSWLRPHVPAELRASVVAYVLAITLMCAAALGATAGGAPPAVAVGALAFALSDLSVARERFVAPGFVNAAWGLPLYFAAQLVLASTVRGAPG